jgi:hypothetical protein
VIREKRCAAPHVANGLKPRKWAREERNEGRGWLPVEFGRRKEGRGAMDG